MEGKAFWMVSKATFMKLISSVLSGSALDLKGKSNVAFYGLSHSYSKYFFFFLSSQSYRDEAE